MKQAQPAPFCDAPAARAAFDRWIQRLSALGLELSDADRYLVGVLASREATLQALRAEVAVATGDALIRLAAAEDRASRGFVLALNRCQQEFEPRVSAELDLPVAVGEGRATPARVIQFGTADDRVKARIIEALGGGRLGKETLRERVPGAQQVFLRALKTLIASGQVAAAGRGTRGAARRYFLRG